MKDQDDFSEGTGGGKEELLDFEFDDLPEDEETDFDFSSNLDDDILELTSIAKEEGKEGEETRVEDIEELLDLNGLEEELGEEETHAGKDSSDLSSTQSETSLEDEASDNFDAELDALVKELEKSEVDASEKKTTEAPPKYSAEEQAPEFEEIDTQEVMELDSDFITKGPDEEEPEEEISEITPLEEEQESYDKEEDDLGFELPEDFLEEVEPEKSEEGIGIESEIKMETGAGGLELGYEEPSISFEDSGPSSSKTEGLETESPTSDVSTDMTGGISEERLQAMLGPMIEKAVEKAVRETMASTAERVIGEAIDSLKASLENSGE